jgi:hypothetical protein
MRINRQIVIDRLKSGEKLYEQGNTYCFRANNYECSCSAETVIWLREHNLVKQSGRCGRTVLSWKTDKVKKHSWKDHWSKDPDRIDYFENELTKSGLPAINEMVIHNANVHLECLSDQCFMLIVENGKHYWHISIFSRSSRSKIEAHVYEDKADLMGSV